MTNTYYKITHGYKIHSKHNTGQKILMKQYEMLIDVF